MAAHTNSTWVRNLDNVWEEVVVAGDHQTQSLIRYDKEELLSVYRPVALPVNTATAPSFKFVSQSLSPVCLTPLSQIEERILHEGVNSKYALSQQQAHGESHGRGAYAPPTLQEWRSHPDRNAGREGEDWRHPTPRHEEDLRERECHLETSNNHENWRADNSFDNKTSEKENVDYPIFLNEYSKPKPRDEPVPVLSREKAEDQPSEAAIWYYLDPQGMSRGPYETEEMMEWYADGYFGDQLMVRRRYHTTFHTLRELLELWGPPPFENWEFSHYRSEALSVSPPDYREQFMRSHLQKLDVPGLPPRDQRKALENMRTVTEIESAAVTVSLETASGRAKEQRQEQGQGTDLEEQRHDENRSQRREEQRPVEKPFDMIQRQISDGESNIRDMKFARGQIEGDIRQLVGDLERKETKLAAVCKEVEENTNFLDRVKESTRQTEDAIFQAVADKERIDRQTAALRAALEQKKVELERADIEKAALRAALDGRMGELERINRQKAALNAVLETRMGELQARKEEAAKQEAASYSRKQTIDRQTLALRGEMVELTRRRDETKQFVEALQQEEQRLKQRIKQQLHTLHVEQQQEEQRLKQQPGRAEQQEEGQRLKQLLQPGRVEQQEEGQRLKQLLQPGRVEQQEEGQRLKQLLQPGRVEQQEEGQRLKQQLQPGRAEQQEEGQRLKQLLQPGRVEQQEEEQRLKQQLQPGRVEQQQQLLQAGRVEQQEKQRLKQLLQTGRVEQEPAAGALQQGGLGTVKRLQHNVSPLSKKQQDEFLLAQGLKRAQAVIARKEAEHQILSRQLQQDMQEMEAARQQADRDAEKRSREKQQRAIAEHMAAWKKKEREREQALERQRKTEARAKEEEAAKWELPREEATWHAQKPAETNTVVQPAMNEMEIERLQRAQREERYFREEAILLPPLPSVEQAQLQQPPRRDGSAMRPSASLSYSSLPTLQEIQEQERRALASMRARQSTPISSARPQTSAERDWIWGGYAVEEELSSRAVQGHRGAVLPPGGAAGGGGTPSRPETRKKIRTSRDEIRVMELFGQLDCSVDGIYSWSAQILSTLTTPVDVHTLVELLLELPGDGEVHELVREQLGGSDTAREFARGFVLRRARLREADTQEPKSPTGADGSFNGGIKGKKQKKTTRQDGSELLSFLVTSPTDRINTSGRITTMEH